MAYFTKGMIADAMSDYNMAIYLDSKLAAAYNSRALADEAQNNLTGAIRDYTHAIHADPRYLVAYTNRGYARIDCGDLRGALADFRRYLSLGGGQLYSNQQEVEARIATIRQQLQGQ
jgi:tetratricopeptide (TPR) repeat protein